jgi:hypothetical protein
MFILCDALDSHLYALSLLDVSHYTSKEFLRNPKTLWRELPYAVKKILTSCPHRICTTCAGANFIFVPYIAPASVPNLDPGLLLSSKYF